MTTTVDRAKHRAAPRSPISTLSQTVASPAARRGALVAASSGLVLTMAATTASAAPQTQDLATAEAGAATLTDSALASLSLSPTVRVPADVAITSFEEIAVTSEPAPPPPAPEPEPVRAATATSSRTTSRTATSSTSTASAPAAAEAPVVASSGVGQQIASIAKQYVGVPYVYGGATPAGFDCSGFTSYVYARVGISIPRSSAGQHALGGVVSASQAPVGALMTWDGHTGIYLGGGMHIAARNPGTPLSISPIYRSNPRYHVLW